MSEKDESGNDGLAPGQEQVAVPGGTASLEEELFQAQREGDPGRTPEAPEMSEGAMFAEPTSREASSAASSAGAPPAEVAMESAAAEAADPAGALIRTIEQLQEEIDTLKRGKAEQQELVLRTHAEMENLRRRTARDIERAHKHSLEGFIRALLPVLDSMELGIESIGSGEEEGLREGMELTVKMFRDLLRRFQVQPLEPVGSPFDPEFHEALSVQQAEGGDGSGRGIVVTVVQKGYVLHERLLRPAKVVISR